MKNILLLLSVIFVFSCSSFKNGKLSGLYPTNVKKKDHLLKVIWAKNNDPEYDTGNLPVALNSPVIHEGMVFAGHNGGHMMVYELSNGRLLWKKKDLGGYHSKPIIYKDDLIYGTNQGRVYSRNYLNGRVKYAVDLGASVESEGVVYKGLLFFHLRNNSITCLDVETGKILWSYKRSVPFITTLQRVSTPLVINSKLYVGFADGHIAAFSTMDGALLWERKLSSGIKFIDIDNSPVYFRNMIFINSFAGVLHALDANTGSVVRRSTFLASRAPVIVRGKLRFGTVDGDIVLTDMNFKEIKKVKVSDKSISSIINWKKKLVVSDIGGNLFVLNGDTFKLVEKMHLGHPISAVFGSLETFEDYFSVISSRNRLYVFK